MLCAHRCSAASKAAPRSTTPSRAAAQHSRGWPASRRSASRSSSSSRPGSRLLQGGTEAPPGRSPAPMRRPRRLWPRRLPLSSSRSSRLPPAPAPQMAPGVHYTQPIAQAQQHLACHTPVDGLQPNTCLPGAPLHAVAGTVGTRPTCASAHQCRPMLVHPTKHAVKPQALEAAFALGCRAPNKEPGSPVQAGDPRLIDELMQEMIGGAAWPAGQGTPSSFQSGVEM